MLSYVIFASDQNAFPVYGGICGVAVVVRAPADVHGRGAEARSGAGLPSYLFGRDLDA